MQLPASCCREISDLCFSDTLRVSHGLWNGTMMERLTLNLSVMRMLTLTIHQSMKRPASVNDSGLKLTITCSVTIMMRSQWTRLLTPSRGSLKVEVWTLNCSLQSIDSVWDDGSVTVHHFPINWMREGGKRVEDVTSSGLRFHVANVNKRLLSLFTSFISKTFIFPGS